MLALARQPPTTSSLHFLFPGRFPYASNKDINYEPFLKQFASGSPSGTTLDSTPGSWSCSPPTVHVRRPLHHRPRGALNQRSAAPQVSLSRCSVSSHSRSWEIPSSASIATALPPHSLGHVGHPFPGLYCGCSRVREYCRSRRRCLKRGQYEVSTSQAKTSLRSGRDWGSSRSSDGGCRRSRFDDQTGDKPRN